jgi:hypothetical protein
MDTNIQPSIKISEMDQLSEQLLPKCEVAAIAPGDLDELRNYRLKLSNHYYNKAEVDTAITKSELKLLKYIDGIEIPEGYDDTALSALVSDYRRHLKGLLKGAFVGTAKAENTLDSSEGSKIPIADVDEDENLESLSDLSNILYTPLNSDKVLISSDAGKISASSISVTELNALQGVSTNIQAQLNELYDRIQVLETTIKNSSTPTGFINFKAGVDIPIKSSAGVYPPKPSSKYSNIVYTPSTNAWVFTQFTRGDGGDTNSGPRIYMKHKDEPDEAYQLLTHIISYDYGQASILIPVQKDITIKVVAIAGNIKRARTWPML